MNKQFEKNKDCPWLLDALTAPAPGHMLFSSKPSYVLATCIFRANNEER
jgi:hypothetical protein